MKTNLQFIQEYVTGDDGALETLFFERNYYSSCFFKAKRYVSSDHDAHTVAGDTFFALKDKSLEQRVQIFAKGVYTEAGFRNYMLTIAENKAKDIAQKESKKPDPLPPDVDMPETDPIDLGEPPPPDPSEQLEACAAAMAAAEPDNPKEAARKPLDSAFLKVWRKAGTYDNGPFYEAFGMSDDDLIRKTKQRITRRLRRCLGID